MDPIEAVEVALAEFKVLFGPTLVDDCPVVVQAGELLPVVTRVTDNGGPFRAFRFETPVSQHPELRHVRIRVKSPRHFLTRGTHVDIEPQASSLLLPVEGG